MLREKPEVFAEIRSDGDMKYPALMKEQAMVKMLVYSLKM